MTHPTPTRRTVLTTLGATGLCAAAPLSAEQRILVQVVKDPDCGCCDAWIGILHRAGFEMEVWNASYDQLQGIKRASGISEEMASCHTARVDGYTIEGHVPPADIRRLLSERPAALGLAVPGMPYGSPGMGPEAERDAYDVFLIRPDGRTEVFTHYEAG